MNKSFLAWCSKSIFFTVSVLILLLPFARMIHDYKNHYEVRKSILNRASVQGYEYALLGDSVFCSEYVNDESNSIWGKFHSLTGRKIFPGALSGSRSSDLVNSAIYLSDKMKPGSKVFVDVTPLRFVLLDKNREYNHEEEFADLLLGERWQLYRYYMFLNVDYLRYLGKLLKKDPELDVKINFNRRWDVDGDYARNRYKSIVSQQHQLPTSSNLQVLKDIKNTFRKKEIDTIFVLTPLNKRLVYSFSDKTEADKFYQQLKEANRIIKDFLYRNDAETIDLFESVPAQCFADLMHTNECGDEIMANSLAGYVLARDGKASNAAMNLKDLNGGI